MVRDRRHFTLSGIGKARPFAAKTGGSPKHPSDVNHREAHAKALLTALDHLPNIAENKLPGVYLAIEGRPHEVMVTKSLNASGLTLLKVEKQPGAPAEATVFATEKGIEKLRKKIEDFGGDLPVNQDGSFKSPKNADLVQSIRAISEAGLRALWRSPGGRFPTGPDKQPWEVWLGKTDAAGFLTNAADYGVAVGTDRLEFPEDVVVIAVATAVELAAAVRNLGAVRALATPRQSKLDLHAMDMQLAGRSNLDKRIMFAMAIDPVPVDMFEMESFREVTIPVLIVNLGKPSAIPLTALASGAAKAMPNSTYSTLENATHFSMFGVCKPGAAELAKTEEITDPICMDGEHVTRPEIHKKLIDITYQAFTRALKSAP